MTERQRVPAPGGATYSDAVVVEAGSARWIYVAGQTPREPAPPDLAGQTERCFAQIEEVLAECGAALGDVLQITVYLTNLGDFHEFSEVRGRVFGAEPPASAAVGVASLLGGVLVEISAVAVVT
jgi:enamine deaminase RidA (YjgF/YER057c/UK114 family)